MNLHFTAIAAGAAILLASGAASAQPAAQEKTASAIRHVCTGVSEDERNDPRWRLYPLKIVFAERSGAYLAGVAVTIQRGDSVVLHATCATPWLLVDLPAGSYRVAGHLGARAAGDGSVAVQPGEQTEVTLRFPTGPTG